MTDNPSDETIFEAARVYANKYKEVSKDRRIIKFDFIEGAKWARELAKGTPDITTLKEALEFYATGCHFHWCGNSDYEPESADPEHPNWLSGGKEHNEFDYENGEVARQALKANTSGECGKPDEFKNLYPKYKCPKCGDWFHMPYKYCECTPKKEKE